MKDRESGKKRILDRKWEGLKKLGLTRPTSSEENAKRAQEAHVPRDVVRPSR